VLPVNRGQALRKPVTVGLDDGTRAEIISGLSGDENVVKAYASSLADGPARGDLAARTEVTRPASNVLKRPTANRVAKRPEADKGYRSNGSTGKATSTMIAERRASRACGSKAVLLLAAEPTENEAVGSRLPSSLEPCAEADVAERRVDLRVPDECESRPH